MIEIASILEYTKLGPLVTDRDIMNLCDEAVLYKIPKICIAPNKLLFARDYIAAMGIKGLQIVTVIGYPHGTQPVATKVAEIGLAVSNGAEEFDVVVDVSNIIDYNAPKLSDELKIIRCSTIGFTLKAIVEAPLLTDKQLNLATRVIATSGFDYIKTSTGLTPEPALPAVTQIKRTLNLMNDTTLRIKASGGICTAEQVISLLRIDPNIRIGTSKAIQILTPENQ